MVTVSLRDVEGGTEITERCGMNSFATEKLAGWTMRWAGNSLFGKLAKAAGRADGAWRTGGSAAFRRQSAGAEVGGEV